MKKSIDEGGWRGSNVADVMKSDDNVNEDESSDFSSWIFRKFTSISPSNHQHICTIISQQLGEQGLTPSPITFLGSIILSLDRLSPDPSSPTAALDSLVLLLSLVLPKISLATLRSNKILLFDLVVNLLRGGRLSDTGVAAAFECLFCLLSVGSSLHSHHFASLLTFLTHANPNPKVRRQLHKCIRDVLLSFQGSSLLSSSSQQFSNLLGELLLSAGASKGVPAENASQQILHVLEALQVCLPYISLTSKTSIFNYYTTLLGLRMPLVTRLVSDSLYILSTHPTVEVNPQALADVLCFLADVAETSAVALTFTARLLDAGMCKVHSLNRDVCILKLPKIVLSLKVVFGSGFEEARLAATEAFKHLIQTCIDEELIKEGVNPIKSSSDLINKISVRSAIEEICANIRSLIDNRYRDEWGLAFQVVSAMFDKLGEFSYFLMKGTLENLADIGKNANANFLERKQFQECVGSALVAMGSEAFLTILPLNLRADCFSEINDWLFPILKQYTVGARLRFYVESLLGTVKSLKQKSEKLKLEGEIQLSGFVNSVIYQIWTLLPAFCNYSCDTAESFNLLKKVLLSALGGEPELHGIICSSLQKLIQQNRCVLEGTTYLHSDKLTISYERAITHYNKEVASANMAVLRSSARDFFSVLFNVYLNSTKDPGGILLATVGEFASVAGKNSTTIGESSSTEDIAIVPNFFRLTMEKLLRVTEKAGRAENSRSSMKTDKSSSDDNSLSRARARLFDFAASLLPGLGGGEIELLYSALGPALKDVNGSIQKKAYKVLSMVLKNFEGNIATTPWNLVDLMGAALPSCHFSAKRHRLDCLYHLIVYIAKVKAELERVEFISSFLSEILLSLKEANKNTRNSAYDVLVQIGCASIDEDDCANYTRLLEFFYMVTACLSSESPHMSSAAVKGLARLTYEFSVLLPTAHRVLPLAFSQHQMNKEMIKANLGLLKVLVAKSQSENLLTHLKSTVEGMFKWPYEIKKHFRAKVKHLLEMLVRKCGHDAVKAVIPEEHMKLLVNIRKIEERREKKLGACSETGSYLSKAATSRRSKWSHSKVFSGFGEERSDVATSVGRRSIWSSKMKSRASSIRKPTKLRNTLSEDLLHQLEDEPYDFLDKQKTMIALESGRHLKRKHDSDDELEIDENGKLIIPGPGDPKSCRSSNQDSADERSEVSSFMPKNTKMVQKRRKMSKSGWAYTGNEYASKRARGDIKKKGKLEPYAYWPLDYKMLSRRPEHRASARRGMSSVGTWTKRLEGKSVATALAAQCKKRKKASRKK